MKIKKIFLLLTALLTGSNAITTDACTNLIVGKNASTDGSVIVTYNADNFGLYGFLRRYPAAKHPKGTKRDIYDGDTNHYWGQIDEAPETYSVIGNINEFQVSICETTFGGRLELVNPNGIIDYVSLMSIALQRSKTAREAIEVMTSLTDKYGYNSEGETFTVADKNEAWILEMIGKGPKEKGTVWVAVRIPDDCICAHANQSRIHQFDRKDKQNVMYAKDVITFARKKGYFNGKDEDFSFADAYCPAGFSELRFCEARVWSFFNKWVDGMDKYLAYASGTSQKKEEPMPLFFKPKKKLSVHDVMMSMRDHYEGTPFDMTSDISCGEYESPYRTTPLTWEYNGKQYFNERPIATQQTGFTLVAQLRSYLPDAIGGIEWFGNDDANMVPYTPIYCSTTDVPTCYAEGTASDTTFSWKSAFWVCNWVSNMVYPRYSQMFPSLESKRNELEASYLTQQKAVEQKALELWNSDQQAAKKYLNEYSNRTAEDMLNTWKTFGEYLIMKYNDQTVKPEKNGKFERTKDGLAVPPQRTGFPQSFRKVIVEQTKDRYLVPNQK